MAKEIEFTDEEMAEFRKYLNVEGFESTVKDIMERLIIDFNPTGKSETGNVVIMGNEKTGKTKLAIEMIKLINKKRGRKNRKLAKIKASALNKMGFKNSLKKLVGCDLIIENANNLDEKTVTDIIENTKEFTDDMLIVLEGETEGMKEMLESSVELKEIFNYLVQVSEYDIHQWVAYGIEYAKIKGYTVDELSNLALYKAVDDCFGENNGIDQDDIEGIIDRAISRAHRLRRKFTGLFTSHKDDEGLFILLESDFNN